MTIHWTAINTGLSGDALNVYRFLLDPWSSNGTTLTGAYIATKDGIYKTSGLPTPTWTQVLSPATMASMIGANNAGYPISQFTREMVLPINVQNYVAVIGRKSMADGTHRYYWVYSTNGGTSWNCDTSYYWSPGPVTGNQWNLSDIDGAIPIFAFPSHKVANTIYMSLGVQGADGTPTHGKGLVTSTDGGVTWGAAQDWDWASGSGPRYIVLPFANASGTPYANDLKAWKCHVGEELKEILTSTSFPGPGFIDKTTWTTVHAMDANIWTWIMDICTWDEDYIYVLTAALGTPAYSLIYSNDGGSTWSTKALAHVAKLQALSALPGNPLYLAVGTGLTDGSPPYIYRTLDGGANFVDATGDLNTVLSGAGSVRSIVPDWIKST